mgnify:CR=1 FL=1|tara:strand:- start:4929 stop:5777 length:849 start_codon:yes stop_codon:yes gene_type:complete
MKGFINLGNTCYLNSGLQMIIQNQDLCNIVTALKSKSEMLSKFSDFIEEYYNGQSKPLKPKFIKNLVSEKNSIFSGFNQQDSSEFIVFLLELLNTEINKYTENKNIIDKIFEIEITTSTKCKVLSCLNVSENKQNSTILILDVNEECNNLDDCYNLSKSKIKLDGDEKYFCEKCKKKRIASQRKDITKWPKNLIVWIRRYQQKGTKLSKFSQEILVPVEWRSNYHLKGIVFHSGSLYGGHYIYAGKVNDKWYLFNDATVSELSNRELINLINYGYIYYYTKS